MRLPAPLLQAKPVSGQSVATAEAQSSAVMPSGGGEALPEPMRDFFEPRFGRDFSQVRLHTGAQAAESARAVNARAYTVGRDVLFGAGQYAPETDSGLRLLAHELTHVIQQSGQESPLVSAREELHLARAPLDLQRLDQELSAGGPLTQTQGEIGHGSLPCPPGRSGAIPQSCPDAPAVEDTSLPIEAVVYQRTPPPAATGSGASPSAGGSGTTAPDADVPGPDSEIRDAGVPPAAGVPEAPNSPMVPQSGPVASVRTERALVVGGIHGDEGGARGRVLIAERLRTELNAGLRRDFDTILIPVMNPGGLADNTRSNRHGVDLNRNFPGLPGFPTGPSGVVEQPETMAVRQAVQTLRPSRILALHAHGSPRKGGFYADPVEGEARELACRMALQALGTTSGSGVPVSEVMVRGNRVAQNVCESRYPDTASVSVSTTQSSLGAWGSAPVSAGGGGAAVITHEIPSSGTPLPEHGGGRSVDTVMPGIREFLLDNRRAASEADALLQRAVTNTFLSGQGTAADVTLRRQIEGVVTRRFSDLNAFYQGVWRPMQSRTVRAALPTTLSVVSHARDFSGQAGIVTGQLRGLTASSADTDIEREILRVMETRSLPGFSRHHWGTELDVVSATRTHWDPSTGSFRELIPFLQEHAYRFGFFHPYTAGYARSGGQPAQSGFSNPNPMARHYLEEPWHLSYWPIANVLQQLWLSTFTGPVLDNLILETARAIRGPVPEATMVRVLTGIGLSSFQSNVAPSP